MKVGEAGRVMIFELTDDNGNPIGLSDIVVNESKIKFRVDFNTPVMKSLIKITVDGVDCLGYKFSEEDLSYGEELRIELWIKFVDGSFVPTEGVIKEKIEHYV